VELFQPDEARQSPAQCEYDAVVADPRRGMLRRRAVLDDAPPLQLIEGAVSSSVSG
jgi:hypothetical protein